MKIAHFPPSFLPQIGGLELAIHNIAIQQHRAGHKVSVISPWSSWRTLASVMPYELRPLLPKSLHDIVSKARRYGYDLRWLVGVQLAFYQMMYSFDIWHVHYAYPTGFVAVPMLRSMRLPSVLTCHGGDVQKLPEIGYGLRLDLAVEQDIVKSLLAFDRVTAISESMCSQILQLGVPPERIRNIPNGVGASRIQTLQVDRDAVRAEMGWPSDKIILLTVGRNHPVKGYKFIPDIIRQIAAVRRDFLWVIVGRGVGPIAEMAQGLGVEDFIQIVPQIGQAEIDAGRPTFLLPDEKLIQIYKAADTFVSPSMLEGMSLTLLEAMAAQLAIVTTDAPGCRDVVQHGVTGLLSPVGDTSRMADHILRLMADRSLLAELGQKGRLCSADYEWSSVASRYCAVYKEIVPPNEF